MITDIVNPGSSDAKAILGTEIPEILRFYQVVQSGEPQARLPYGLTPMH